MTSTAEPYILLDGYSDNKRGLYWSDAYRDKVCDWARSQGMTPEDVACIVVHPGDDPFAVVTVYDLNEEGHRFFLPGTEDTAKHVETVPLSCLPPLPESTR